MRARPELMAKTPSLSFKSNKERKDWKEGRKFKVASVKSRYLIVSCSFPYLDGSNGN
jgi:hypothetical protein